MTEYIESDNKTPIMLHSVKCTRCSHLFPTNQDAKTYNSCHFSTGNDMCPAEELKFVVAINKKSKVEKLVESFKNDDVQGAIEQLSRMLKYSSAERQGILSEILKIEVKKQKKKSSKSKGK